MLLMSIYTFYHHPIRHVPTLLCEYKAIMVTYYYICKTIIRSLLVIFFGTVVKVTRGSISMLNIIYSD